MAGDRTIGRWMQAKCPMTWLIDRSVRSDGPPSALSRRPAKMPTCVVWLRVFLWRAEAGLRAGQAHTRISDRPLLFDVGSLEQQHGLGLRTGPRVARDGPTGSALRAKLNQWRALADRRRAV